MRESKYKTCIDCIVTFYVFNGDEDELASQLENNDRTLLNEESEIRGEMTTIRSVENTIKTDSKTTLENSFRIIELREPTY